MAERPCNMEQSILIVDDDLRVLRLFERYLDKHGVAQVETLSDPRQLISRVTEKAPDLILLDLLMPHVTGEELLESLASEQPQIPVIVITANADVQTVVRCMKAGAVDYLEKPIQEGALLSSVRQALEIVSLRHQNAKLRACVLSSRIESPEVFEEIVTRDEGLLRVFQYTEAISMTSQPVLVTGETGTGKELIARAIHGLSKRKGKFVCVNAAGLDDEVFSDTLFGHKQGAYTGAHRSRSGLIQQAAGGTLFLDEIGHLPSNSQIKLLRFLQEHEYLPLGADQPEYSDARVVAATNVDSQELQNSKDFRSDLFFRLCAHHVHLPPLRDRREDIVVLLDHFIEEACESMERTIPSYPPELVLLLKSHSFPGNVRELRSMVYDAIGSHGNGMLAMSRFKTAIDRSGGSTFEGSSESPLPWPHTATQLPTLKEAESYLIEEALRRSEGNQSIAARHLGISRQALNKRLSRLARKD